MTSVPLPTFPGIPSTPSDLFKSHFTIEATFLPVVPTAFQSCHDYPPCLGRWDAGKAGNGSGEVTHDVPDRERTVFEQDAG